MGVKNVLDFARDMFMFEASVAHFLSFLHIGIHSYQSRYERQVGETFPRLFPAFTFLQVALFSTVWTLVTVTMRPNKAATRIYAAVIFFWFETGQETQSSSANINSGYLLLRKNKGQLFECRIGSMGVDFISVCPKHGHVSTAKSFTC
jgi:hypothetical protein